MPDFKNTQKRVNGLFLNTFKFANMPDFKNTQKRENDLLPIVNVIKNIFLSRKDMAINTKSKRFYMNLNFFYHYYSKFH